MKLALIIVHNKGDQGNFDQIETVKPLIRKVTDHHSQEDGEGRIQEFYTYHYEVKDLNTPHELKCYQVFPFGVVPPANKDDIDSHKVYYGAGDEDKTGDHPRFFNWGNKRAVDFGAEIVIHVKNAQKLNFKELLPDLIKLDDKQDKTDFVGVEAVNITTLVKVQKSGQLDETKTKEEALEDFKKDIPSKIEEVKHG